MANIPKIIHLTCKEKKVPENYVVFLNKIRELHPAWIIKIYSDEDCVALVEMKFPSLVETYEKLSLAIQKTDLFRLLAIYHYGGFYMDFDMVMIKPLDTLCNKTIIFSEEHIFTNRECTIYKVKHNVQIANYMFGSISNHPFLLRYIDAIKENKEKEILSENDVLKTTGPVLLTDLYYKWRDFYPEITVLQNRDKKCLANCRTSSCHFGDYAAHLHLGSWRWER